MKHRKKENNPRAAADKIAEIMGVSAEKVEPMNAVVMCSGTESAAPDKYIYVGEQSCEAAARLQGGGAKACSFGCLGFGTCASVCKFGAISVIDGVAAGAIKVSDNCAEIDYSLCTQCGACAAKCPRRIIADLREGVSCTEGN